MNTEEKEKILAFAMDIFLREGFYKTTMDEIAARLHMSKKTIYKSFPNKEELVREVIKSFLHLNMMNIKNYVNEECNAVQKLFNIFNYVGQNILRVNERVLSDLHTYAPDLWKEMDEFRTKHMTVNFTKIFNQGKEEGFFLNIKTEIIMSIFIASMRSIVNPAFALNSKIPLREAFESIIEILMNGILTEKGKKIFNKLKNGVIE